MVFVKYRSMYGLIFPFSTFYSHITTLKIDQKPLPTTESTVTSTFWSHGLAEMAGQRNKWVPWPWRLRKKKGISWHLGTDLVLKSRPGSPVGHKQIRMPTSDNISLRPWSIETKIRWMHRPQNTESSLSWLEWVTATFCTNYSFILIPIFSCRYDLLRYPTTELLSDSTQSSMFTLFFRPSPKWANQSPYPILCFCNTYLPIHPRVPWPSPLLQA